MSFFKPWYRPRNFILATFTFIVTGFAWMLYESLSLLNQTANPTVNYAAKFRELSEHYVPGGIDARRAEQAWRDFVEAIMLTEQIVVELRAAGWESDDEFQPRFEFDEPAPQFQYVVSGAVLPEVDRERHALAVMRDRGVFERLDALAANAPGFRPIEPPPGRTLIEFPAEFAPSRTTSHALTALMRIAHHDGDEAEMARAFDRTLAIGRTMAHEPMLINRLLAMATIQLAQGELGHLLMEKPPQPDTLRALIESMNRHELPPFEVALEGERFAVHDLIQRNFTDDGKGDGFLLPSAYLSVTNGFGASANIFHAYQSRFLLARRRETKHSYDQYMDWVIEQSRRPAWEREEFEQREATLRERLTLRRFFTDLVAGAIDRTLHNDTAVQMRTEGLRIMLALELHRAEHGEYPASLYELDPAIMRRAPVDPLHGGPFGYRLLENDPHNRPYFLYSFGIDGIDNAGRERDERRYDALGDPDEGAGYDFVINAPREEWWDG